MDGIEPSSCCLRNSDSAYWVTSAQESPRIVIVTHVLSGRERFNCTIWAVYFWKPQWGLATPALYSSKDYGPTHGHRHVDGPAATHSRKAVSGLRWCPSGVTFISLVTLFVNNRIDVKWRPQSCDTSLQRCYQLHISFQRCCQLHANILIEFYSLPGLNSFSISWRERFNKEIRMNCRIVCPKLSSEPTDLGFTFRFCGSSRRSIRAVVPKVFRRHFVDNRWSWWTDLNPRPADYKSAALPTELHRHNFALVYSEDVLLFYVLVCMIWVSSKSSTT